MYFFKTFLRPPLKCMESQASGKHCRVEQRPAASEHARHLNLVSQTVMKSCYLDC